MLIKNTHSQKIKNKTKLSVALASVEKLEAFRVSNPSQSQCHVRQIDHLHSNIVNDQSKDRISLSHFLFGNNGLETGEMSRY